MKRIISLALCFLLMFTLCQPVLAEEGSVVTWTGATSDDWGETGNWDPAQVPGAGDTAVITTPAAVAVVYNSATAALDCSGEVSVASGGQLNLTGTSYLRGDNAKLDGDGDITLTENSELQWRGGIIDGSGRFILEQNSRLVVDTDMNVSLCRYFVNEGQITVNGGEFYLMGGGEGTGSIEVSDDGYLSFEEYDYSIGGDFVNSGSVTIWDDATVHFGNFRQESMGAVDLKVWGTGSDEYGKLVITDEAQLGGVLEIDFFHDYSPQPGDTFEVLSCSSRTGEFSAIINNMEDEGIVLIPTYAATGLILTVGEAPEPGEDVCEIPGKGGYTTLAQALAAAQDGDTIRLLGDINYNSCISIIDKSITFDLNGFDLNVDSIAVGSDPHEVSGLYVKGNAAVNLTGEGEFNVQGSCYGVYAEGNKDTEGSGDDLQTVSVTVTNATGVLQDGIFARYATVTVREDVASWGGDGDNGIMATDNSIVVVEGNVHANGDSVTGITSEKDAEVTVKGNVEVYGKDSVGLKAGEGGDVAVEGSVNVSGSDCIGVYLLSIAGQPSIVTVKGLIIASKYLVIETDEYSNEHSFENGFFDPGVSVNSRYYTEDGESYVYVSMFTGGKGTEEDPYLIANEAQLYNIREYFLDGKHFKQIADIDLSGYFSLGEGWQPIGNGEVPFTGIYDGNGYTISNLFIERLDDNEIGLFAVIGTDAEIRNLGLINVDVTGGNLVGGLAGANYGLITNSYVTGKVEGISDTGGLTGRNIGSEFDSELWGSISDSYFEGNVTASGDNIGGLVGYQEEGSITGCYADATVKSDGSRIGGLIGFQNRGSITHSYTEATVEGTTVEGKGNNVGGLAGESYGLITDSYAGGVVKGNSYVGGLIGLNRNPAGNDLTNSYFAGTVTASGDYTGGLVGDNRLCIIDSCWADATVTSTGDYVGGLVGCSPGLITNSYSTGTVTGERLVGGLAGASIYLIGSGEITSSYSTCAVEGKMLVGGLVGENQTPIRESFAKGSVKGTEDDTENTYAGGLVGYNGGPISNSYAWGAVSGQDMLGGLVGYNRNLGSVINCYSIGKVSEGNITGGLIGKNDSGTVTGSFWNNNTSNQTSSDGGESIGSVAMSQQATYVNAGWDFSTIWSIDPSGFNDKYPFLKWQREDEFAGGSGTEEDPYLIETVNQLNNVRNYLGTGHSDKYFRLNANLNLGIAPYNSDAGWEPIGTSANPFAGSFDGGGHSISNLYIRRNASSDIGLFGYIAGSGKISNLELKDVDVISYSDYVGGLAGRNYGLIDNCSVAGTVKTNDWHYPIGGLAGENHGTIIYCSFDGSVESGEDYCGGLVGRDEGTIIRCHTKGTVKGYAMVGGLVGYKVKDTGHIKESYSECNVEGSSYDIGGLVGNNDGRLEGCFALGSVKGKEYVGGLVGYNYRPGGVIINCYALGSVEGNDYIGGLAGGNSNTIACSYSAGEVSGTPGAIIGGLVGKATTNGSVDKSYWDLDTALQSSSAGGEGRTTAQMKQLGTYEEWDFDTIWNINGSVNNGYPFLRWQIDAPATTIPTAPQNFTATPGDGLVELSWTAPTSDGGSAIIRYEVSSDNGSTWVTASSSTSHTFTGLINGATYTFKVRAVNSVGNGAEASVSATPTATPVPTYTVTVKGSYAASNGAGSYEQGETVTIYAGSRANYRFSCWTSSDGVTFANANNITTTFIMPARDVTVTANWTYIPHMGDDDDDDGGDTGDSGEKPGSSEDEGDTPSTPAYEAFVIAGSGTEATLPVNVDQDTETAYVDVSSQGLEQGENIIIMPSIPDVDTYSIGIPVPDLSTSDFHGTLTVNTDAGNITVPSNMLTGVEGVDGNMAKISIGQGDKSVLPDDLKAAISDRPLIRLTLSIDGKQIDWSNPNAPVTVSISYTPTDEELENPESIVVWYIDGSGNVVTILNGHYDPETGMVTFSTTHFNNYAVVYNKVNFNDVAEGVWYHKAISFMAARGIISGMGDGNFAPEGKLTRAELLVMVMKAYGIAADTQPSDNFADAGNTWYTGYLAAAKRLGISSGVGDNLFMPEKEVTRQEMFTLLYNILKFIGQLPQGYSGKTLPDFSDASEIAPWAEEAVKFLVESGTVSGSGNRLLPKDITTRAQMAQVLYNLLTR